ncbi:MAG TPA: hypothetical protein VGY54_06155 [Polyangiaceae bacterium]|jgi:hypothetical protein|nr:hypothetical protein [Polyangiaceae bacterium]
MRPAVSRWVALLVAATLWTGTGAARAEQGSAALASSLERIRSDPALSNDPATIDRLAQQAASSPADKVRGEARMLVAEAWLRRMNRPEDAIRELRAVADDPTSDTLTAQLAAREIVATLVARGELAKAESEAITRADRLDSKFVAQVGRLVRRRFLRAGSLFELGLFVTLVCIALFRAPKVPTRARVSSTLRKLAPLTLAFAAFLGVVGGVMASKYESGNAVPFLLLGLVALPLVLLAGAWAAVGSTRAPARVGRALLCGASVVATAFVLLDAYRPTYLEGFGL